MPLSNFQAKPVVKRSLGVSGETWVVDVYEPVASGPRPAIVVIPGGGGKDILTGGETCGRYAAAYHDLAEALAATGNWCFVPSRRGDPRRTLENAKNRVASFYMSRLPEALLEDPQECDGQHTHLRFLEEVEALLFAIPGWGGNRLDSQRVGILGKSAGSSVAIAAAARNPDGVRAVGTWCGTLTTSQWFKGPKADVYMTEVLGCRGIRFDRASFVAGLVDAVDYLGEVRQPVLFGCGAEDRQASPEVGPDKWTSPGEQITLLNYATRSADARAVVLKGAEHTMAREAEAWPAYRNLWCNWFGEVLGDCVT